MSPFWLLFHWHPQFCDTSLNLSFHCPSRFQLVQPAVAGIYCLDFMGRTLYWEGVLAEGNPLQMILMGRRVETFRPQDILFSHLKTLLGCMCCTSEVSMAGATFSQQNWRGNSKSIRVFWDFQLSWCSVQWWWCLSSFGSKTMCHAINAGRTLASKCLGNDHFGSWMRYFGTKWCPRSKLVYKNASNIIKL